MAQLPKDEALSQGVKLERKQIVSACIMRVEVGTNTPRGGDAGHGGRTILDIVMESDASLDVTVGDQTFHDTWRATLVFGGDAEAICIAQALRFAADVLDRQIAVNKG